VPESPLDAHVATPQELRDRIAAERRGTPFLVYRDVEDQQAIVDLDAAGERITIGRRPSNAVVLDWDSEVSRVHAALERMGDEWTVVDDGLSRNGTFVNGERINGRRRLEDGDSVRFGGTTMIFRSPQLDDQQGTAVASQIPTAVDLSTTQRKVLTALCRPYKEGTAFATPATNQQIADELFLSVDAVKTHLRVLFAKFGIEQLPQNQKRIRLVERAFYAGLITERDL
jgi:pSer/pThr/pTyr-binding forkhead associated (FHA) protein